MDSSVSSSLPSSWLSPVTLKGKNDFHERNSTLWKLFVNFTYGLAILLMFLAFVKQVNTLHMLYKSNLHEYDQAVKEYKHSCLRVEYHENRVFQGECFNLLLIINTHPLTRAFNKLIDDWNFYIPTIGDIVLRIMNSWEYRILCICIIIILFYHVLNCYQVSSRKIQNMTDKYREEHTKQYLNQAYVHANNNEYHSS